MIDFCFAIMSFGERYNKQSERFILDRNNHCKDIPIIVITDNTDYFKNFDNVYPINVGEYNEKYLNYGNKYYNFDSSCKRFLIPSALKLGYKNIVIIDNDNHFLKTWNTLLFRNLFKTNHISAPIVYNYKNHLKLGDMVLYYSNHFNFSIHQNEIRNLPEGCINLLSFDTEERGYNFYNTWNECVMLRDKNKMFKNILLKSIVNDFIS